MYKFKKILNLIWLLIIMFSCGCVPSKNINKFFDEYTDPRLLEPQYKTKNIFPHMPTGDDSYSQGWQDGCATFTGIMASGLYRTIPAKIDAERAVKDAWYLRGYQDASNFCTLSFDWETH